MQSKPGKVPDNEAYEKTNFLAIEQRSELTLSRNHAAFLKKQNEYFLNNKKSGTRHSFSNNTPSINRATH